MIHTRGVFNLSTDIISISATYDKIRTVRSHKSIVAKLAVVSIRQTIGKREKYTHTHTQKEKQKGWKTKKEGGGEEPRDKKRKIV